MDNTNKELILDELRGASTIINNIAFYYASAGSGVLYTTGIKAITWDAAADGKLTMSSTIDIENVSGVTLNPLGFVLLSSGAYASPTTVEHAVSVYAFPGGAITLEDGEIIRIQTAEYTVD